MKAIRRVGKPLDRSEPAFIRTQIQDRPSDCLFHGAPSFTEEDPLSILRLARPPIKAQRGPPGHISALFPARFRIVTKS
jgi:hypothetical protein